MKIKSTIKWLVTLGFLLGIVGIGQQTVFAASESGTAGVTFTPGQVLNPADPRLPLVDTNGGSTVATNTVKGSGTKQVVVDTTPEKTKAATASSTKQATTSSASTTTRTKLPQTGSFELPAVLVLIAVVFGIGVSAQAFKRSPTLSR